MIGKAILIKWFITLMADTQGTVEEEDVVEETSECKLTNLNAEIVASINKLSIDTSVL